MRDRIKMTPELRRILNAAYPGYRKRRFFREENDTLDVRSYWDSGCRDYFVAVKTDTMQATSESITFHFPKQAALFEQVEISEMNDVTEDWCRFCGEVYSLCTC